MMTILDKTYIHDLCHAINQQNQSDIHQLLTVGQDYNVPDKMGKTPLYYAAAHHDYENVEKLLWNGARPNHGGLKSVAPLLATMHNATIKNTAYTDPVMTLLLQAGADANKTDHKHQTALMHAQTAWQVATLIEYKADVNAQDHQKRNILHHLLKRFNQLENKKGQQASDILKSIKISTEAKANIFHADENGKRPFDTAMAQDCRQLQQIFLNARTTYRQEQSKNFNAQAEKENTKETQQRIQAVIAKKRPIILKRRL